MYKTIIKPLLFLFSPESAHSIVATLLSIVINIPGISHLIKRRFTIHDPRLEKELLGIKFPNPVGLAAGFDKDAKLLHEMAYLGFGFIEVGTVTPKPQAGNPQPRLFRLPDDEALINRMGFNNEGVDAMVKHLKNKPKGIIVGGNIGMNKLTPLDKAEEDYIYCFNTLYGLVDYFVVNVSSPNTPGLRELQDKEPLSRLLHKLMAINLAKPKPAPILLKIAPDLNNSQLDDVIEIVLKSGISGIVATNTTITREHLKTAPNSIAGIGPGGLSGLPLRERATEIIQYIKKKTGNKIVIMGCGGIHSPQDAIDKMNAGADVVQLYTGFIYEGPGLMKEICKGIISNL